MAVRAHLDGLVFAEHVEGRGPEVLALHGWGRSRQDMVPLLAGRQGTAVDLPGFGTSPVPPDAWGARQYADQLAALMRAESWAPQLLLGHSFGGRVAACLGAAHPDLVSGIVFMGTPLIRRVGTGRPAPAYRLVRALHRKGMVSDQRMEAAREKHGSADYRAATGIMRAVLVRVVNESYDDELAALTCPVGFYWGAGDTAASPEVARAAAGMVGHVVGVEIVEGAGHDVHRDAPGGVATMLDAVAVAAGTPPRSGA